MLGVHEEMPTINNKIKLYLLQALSLSVTYLNVEFVAILCAFRACQYNWSILVHFLPVK